MKTKHFTLFLALVATTALWASNVITYTATEKLQETTSSYGSGLLTNAFNVAITSHKFYNGIGTITFAGEVTTIGEWAFAGCWSLTSVTIPNSVTTIGKMAFYHCFGLTSVTIPNSVTTIGDDAFRDCSGLTSPIYNDNCFAFMPSSYKGSYTIPDGIKQIVGGSFYFCTGLTSVTIPNSVTTIGEDAFYYCTGLTSATIGNSVTTIGRSAFEGCSSLISVTIGNSVTTIESEAFYNCSALTKTNYTGTIADWCKIKFGNYSSNPIYYSHNFFINDVEVKDLIIPNSVTTIGNYAFYYCTGLTSVTIGNSVTTIGAMAFTYCMNLTSINVDASNTHYCSVEGVLLNHTKDTLIQYPTSNSRTEYAIPSSVTAIGYYAFWGCNSLISITIPNSVTEIGYHAFEGCSNIKSVTWNAKNCEDWNFGNQVESFVFGDSVEVIPSNICEGMSKLTSITIPYSVTMIGENAFYGCDGIRSVTWNAKICDGWNFGNQVESFVFGDSIKVIPSNICKGMTKLTSITIPNSVISIWDSAFFGCSGLTSITIPNSVTEIGYYAFEGCSNIKSVTWNAKNCDGWNFGNQVESFVFGDSVEVIPGNICSGMDKLTTITIPNSVIEILGAAFSGCSGLTSVTIPNSVIEIGGYAFYDCSGLTSVAIGNSVTTIGDWAFFFCSGLTSITCEAITPPTCGSSCFLGVDKSIPLYVPSSSINAYQMAPEWKEFYNIQAIAGDALDNIRLTNPAQKVLHNGTFIIDRNGQHYSAMGERIR